MPSRRNLIQCVTAAVLLKTKPGRSSSTRGDEPKRDPLDDPDVIATGTIRLRLRYTCNEVKLPTIMFFERAQYDAQVVGDGAEYLKCTVHSHEDVAHLQQRWWVFLGLEYERMGMEGREWFVGKPIITVEWTKTKYPNE